MDGMSTMLSRNGVLPSLGHMVSLFGGNCCGQSEQIPQQIPIFKAALSSLVSVFGRGVMKGQASLQLGFLGWVHWLERVHDT